MMLIKVDQGDGVFDLYEGERVSFLGQGNAIEIPAEDGHPFSADERFPTGRDFCHVVYTKPPLTPTGEGNGIRLVRWVEWFHPSRDECHLLITDGPVYLCNEQGDTVEALR